MPNPSREVLSLAECRRLLSSEVTLDDIALQALRDQLYVLAGAVIAAAVDHSGRRLDALTEADRADAEERAAILEFDGKMARSHAEWIALASRPRHRRQ